MSEQKKQIDYVVTVVSEFASECNMTLKDAFFYLYNFRAIEFLKQNYDIEHTLSYSDVLSDCKLICKKNGGNIV